MGKESETFIFGAQEGWQDASGGAERQILGYNGDIMMVKVRFRKGDIGKMHSHPHSQVTYVLSGVFEFTVMGETRTIKAGDAIYQRPGTPHGCICIEEGELIDCFNPVREEFLTR